MERHMTKESPEFKAFMSVWDFWKNYGTPEDDPEYWNEVVKVGSENVAKNVSYKECWDLSSELLMAVLNVLEARLKSEKEFGDDKHGYEIIMRETKNKNIMTGTHERK